MSPTPPRPNKSKSRIRTRDLVSYRNNLKNLQQNVKPGFGLETDTVEKVWNDPYGNGSLALTRNGHVVSSDKGPGETIVLYRRGGVWMETTQ